MNNNPQQIPLPSLVDKSTELYTVLNLERIAQPIADPIRVGPLAGGFQLDANPSVADVARILTYASQVGDNLSVGTLKCAMEKIQYEGYKSPYFEGMVGEELLPHVPIYWFFIKCLLDPNNNAATLKRLFLLFDPFRYLLDYISSRNDDIREFRMLEGDSGVALAVLCHFYSSARYADQPKLDDIPRAYPFWKTGVYIRALSAYTEHPSQQVRDYADILQAIVDDNLVEQALFNAA